MQIFGSEAERRRFEELGEAQCHLSRGRRRWEVGGGYKGVKLKRKAGYRERHSWFGELGF